MGGEGVGCVGGHGLGEDAHAGVEAVLLRVGVRDDDGGGAAAGRGAGHQAGHDAGPDDLVGQDLLGGELAAEQGERVVQRVAAGLGADGGEGGERGAVALHVLLARAAEVAQREREVDIAGQLVGLGVELVEGAGAVGEVGAERAGLHLFEAERQDAVGAPESMACRARKRAVEPVEQLLLTLTTGMPVMPTS